VVIDLQVEEILWAKELADQREVETQQVAVVADLQAVVTVDQQAVNFQAVEEGSQLALDFHQQAVVNQQVEKAAEVEVKKVLQAEENEDKK